MFPTNLIVLGIFSFIAAVSIIIQTGWKFTHKLVPKLPKNKRWSDIFISTGQLSVIVFIFYTVNIWFWTDSTEKSSDIWKMSNPVKLLQWKASNSSQYLSTATNILTFDEAVDALPEEAEEYTNMLRELRNFRAPELLAKFDDLMHSNECDATLRVNGKAMCSRLRMTRTNLDHIESHPIWATLRTFLKNGPTFEAPFTIKREQIRQHLEYVSESLLIIADKFNKKEQELRNKMVETTNQKNIELVFWYVLPSMIVFIFTLASIFTTRFNSKLRSSLFVRTILNVLFHIVAIHVVVVFVFEIVANSNKCQPDPQLLEFSDFEIPSFNKSSRTITKEDFLNCTATKSHIFAAPNDGIFIPKTIYDDYIKPIPDTLIPVAKPAMAFGTLAFGDVHINREVFLGLVPLVLAHTTNCHPLREFKEVIEKVPKMYEPLVQSVEPFRFDLSMLTLPLADQQAFENTIRIEKSTFFVHKEFPRMQNAINASIQKYNDLINEAGYDCFTMSEAFQHGSNRTCYVINGQLISTAKLVLIGCSVISIITHILTNRKYEIVLEKAKNQQEENQSTV